MSYMRFRSLSLSLVLFGLGLATAGLTAPASASCAVNVSTCAGGDCTVNAGPCNGGVCTVNAGDCEPGGSCLVNTGTCAAACMINIGSCTNGPNATPCNPTQNPHEYANTGVAGDSRDTQADAAFGVESSSDGCTAGTAASVDLDTTHLGDTDPTTNCLSPLSPNNCVTVATTGGDGDPETGVGGGSFPAGPCVPAGTTAHHANADGSVYYISSAVGLIPAALSVGTDGGSVADPCSGGNGVVSNDPTTDPTDCGSGNIGLSTPMIGATIGANVAGLSCTPVGGFVAGFTQTGPIFVDNGHCTLPVVHTGLDNDLNGDPTVPTVDPGDQSGCDTITLQTIAVSVQGFIGDAGF